MMHSSHLPDPMPTVASASLSPEQGAVVPYHLMHGRSGGAGRPRGSFGGQDAKDEKGGGPRVLVVDDNAINRRVLAGMVRAQGCEVETAGNGQDALDQINGDQDFQLIFMDCEMPGMDGFEATRRIRSKWGESLPIVAASAYSSEQDQERCLECGMNDFMSKPLKRPAVREVLEKWIPGAFGRGAA